MNFEEKILEMLTSLGKGQQEMRADIADLKSTQVKQGEQIAAIQATLVKQEEQIAATQATLAEHGAALAEHGAALKRLDKRVEVLDGRSLKSAVLLETDISRDIHLLYEGHSEIVKRMDTLATKEQVDELAGEVHVIKEVVSRHSVDISRLRKAQ